MGEQILAQDFSLFGQQRPNGSLEGGAFGIG
jgi:hypothetical protein